ncbi:MAG: lysine N(6)-hydroxylase/L-ornithine N(5)-oxygenase family protein, partial [Planctomycetia bacterium]|nr:lysine N(6)-hydroxylase/L-ornithine N(5)-oxygenase family protein [Planctomycetia bacterium]
EGLLKGDFYEDERRIDVPFRLLVRDADGTERIEYADVVFDCSGTSTLPNPLGNAGIPARGEADASEYIEYRVPDVLGEDRETYAGLHTLVVGGGYSAATTVVDLASLVSEDSDTRTTWVTRREYSPAQLGPIAQSADDALPEPDALAQRANLLALESKDAFQHFPATYIEAVEWDEAAQNFSVELSGRHAGFYTFDRVVANVGFAPDMELYSQLQVVHCPTTDAPAPLAQLLRRQTATGVKATTAELAQALLNPEPDFYVLGSKSYGRRSDFLLAAGHDQIRALFTIIGDRETLDLYKTHPV